MILAAGKDQRGLALALCRLAEEHRSDGAVNVSKGRGYRQQSAKCKNSLLLASRKILACFQVEQCLEL